MWVLTVVTEWRGRALAATESTGLLVSLVPHWESWSFMNGTEAKYGQ
jgi:hypothetical protein